MMLTETEIMGNLTISVMPEIPMEFPSMMSHINLKLKGGKTG